MGAAFFFAILGVLLKAAAVTMAPSLLLRAAIALSGSDDRLVVRFNGDPSWSLTPMGVEMANGLSVFCFVLAGIAAVAAVAFRKPDVELQPQK
jgi:hypothetical protein